MKKIIKWPKERWGLFRTKRNYQLLSWLFFVVILLILKDNKYIPSPLTYRKIFFIACFLFLFIFRITSKLMYMLGLTVLLLVSVLALFERMGAVSKLVIYAWGFFLTGGFLQMIESIEDGKQK